MDCDLCLYLHLLYALQRDRLERHDLGLAQHLCEVALLRHHQACFWQYLFEHRPLQTSTGRVLVHVRPKPIYGTRQPKA